MPKPRSGESKQDFISRCIPFVLREGKITDRDQAAGYCYSIWNEASKDMDPNELLLKAIKERTGKKTAFNYGILTADRYVQTLLDAVGSDVCYRVAAKELTSFADVMTKAANTLVYSNEDSEVHEKLTTNYGDKLPEGVELPKNTLMVFKHTLTTPRKDRDGDVLHPEGMLVDPKMLLLWQHVHTMPIGKMLAIAIQNSKTLDLWSCIVDMNETCHDSAVMVDNGMGRFSHGFKATEFEKVKAKPTGEAGFEVFKGEIMEESLVSVPANIDSETQDVILSLVEGGKLTSPVMKEVGKTLKEKKPTTVPVELDLKVTVTQENKNESSNDKGETGTSKETEEGSDKGGEDEGKGKAGDSEVKKEDEGEKEGKVCPKCGSEIKEGACVDCGYKTDEAKEKPKKKPAKEDEEEEKSVKKGRVISAENEKKLRDAADYMEEAYNMDVSKPCKACISYAKKSVNDVLTSLGTESGKESEVIEKKFDMADWVANSTKQERERLVKTLKHLNDMEYLQAQRKKIRNLFRAKK